MDRPTFEAIMREQFAKTESVLAAKRDEYVGDDAARAVDVLQNFKKAAASKGISPHDALHGMLLKHLISISDMVVDRNTQVIHEPGKWDEKITDAINYLILLRAIVEEDNQALGVQNKQPYPPFTIDETALRRVSRD